MFAAATAVLLALVAGCAAPTSSLDTDSADTSYDPTTGAFTTLSPVRAASIPSLEFVDPSSVPDSVEVIQGMRLEPGTYEVIMTGERISSVEWAQEIETGQVVLWLGLDEEGTAVIADWSMSHIGESLPLLLGGRVVSVPTIVEPIIDGSIAISADDGTDLRSTFESATVPAP